MLMAAPYVIFAGSSHAVRGFNFIQEMLDPASGSASEAHIRYFRNVEVLALGGTSAHTYEYYLTRRQGDQRDCITSPHDVQLVLTWIGSNDIDYHYRQNWHSIPDNEVENLRAQIQRDADRLVVKIMDYLDWLQRFMPRARLTYCSITPRGYWNEYPRRVQQKVNIGVEVQAGILVARTWQHLPLGGPPFTLCYSTHYTRLAYHVLFTYLHTVGMDLIPT